MASKIRELKDTVVQQNELVKTLRDEKTTIREALVGFYSAAARYRPDFMAGMTAVEDIDMPEIKHEDLTKAQPADIVRRLATVFTAIVGALEANRKEVSSVYKELDQDVEDAMAGWRNLQALERHDQKAEHFRSAAVADAAKKRPETPENVPANGAGGHGPALPPTPPDTAGEKRPEPVSTNKANKQTGGTTTLEKMLSPGAKPKPQAKK